LFAGLIIFMLPVLIVYIVFQRRVEEGLTVGALK
jgi:N-acetylglucosamine transport system permease protein